MVVTYKKLKLIASEEELAFNCKSQGALRIVPHLARTNITHNFILRSFLDRNSSNAQWSSAREAICSSRFSDFYSSQLII